MMPSTCCVGGCKSNYETEIRKTGETVQVYSFPSKNDKERDRQPWFDCLPNVVNDTESKRICIKHWPENFKTVPRKGKQVPANLPSVFSLPKSFCRQSIGEPRNLKQRGVDSESRSSHDNEKKDLLMKVKDMIKSLSELEIFCKKIDNILFAKRDDSIQLHEISDKIPPTLLFSIIIYNNFTVDCYKDGYYIPVRDLLGFSAKLEKYSQLPGIIERVRTFQLSTADIAKTFGSNLQTLIENSENDEELTRRVLFLAEQLKAVSTKPTGQRYSEMPISFRCAVTLFLRSRNCYNELRKLLNLPTPKTIKSCFGKLGTPGSIDECQRTANKAFSMLEGNQLDTKIMVDEIHIAPSIRYRGDHLIGSSVDQPDKAAKTVLRLLVETMFGGPSFMGRLLPVYSIDSEILFDQIQKMMAIIHNAGGFVFLVLNDNLRANQKTFKLFHAKFGYICNQPPCTEFRLF